jgi:hypothetical protein
MRTYGRVPWFVAIAVTATAAALAAWQMLLVLGVGGDALFGASIVHPGLILDRGRVIAAKVDVSAF